MRDEYEMQEHIVRTKDRSGVSDERREEWWELGVWVAADGSMTRVDEMDDRYLLNVVRWIRRTFEAQREAWMMEGYALESMLRGEMALATLECEMGMVDAMEADDHPFMVHALAELDRRGLEEMEV